MKKTDVVLISKKEIEAIEAAIKKTSLALADAWDALRQATGELSAPTKAPKKAGKLDKHAPPAQAPEAQTVEPAKRGRGRPPKIDKQVLTEELPKQPPHPTTPERSSNNGAEKQPSFAFPIMPT